MQGEKQFNEKLFTNFQLSERVPAENFYRRLKEVLNLHWLYKATAKYYGTEGQQSIDPIVFFKLMLIGYLENLGSDRRIIHTVSLRLDMLFFIGYDIDEALPWHSTLSRIRQLYGEELFKQLFKDVLKQCIDKGMVTGRRQVLDSVAVKANAGIDSLVEKEILDDASAYADELKNEEEKSDDIDDIKNDDNNKTVSAARNKAVQLHHQWKAKAYKNMPQGSKERQSRAKFVSNHTHYSTTDPDARVSVKPGKPRQLYYTAQVSVDTAHHVITQIQTDHADKRDSQCLPSLLTNTISNLKEEGLQIEEVFADAGYSSGEALKALEENNITGYIPNFGQYKPYYDRMHARWQTVKREKIRQLRSSTVEPVLGTLVNYLAIRRVNTRGIKQAAKCILMSAIAYNLKKLLKWEVRKIKAMAMAKVKEVKNGLQTLCFFFFRSLQLCPLL